MYLCTYSTYYINIYFYCIFVNRGENLFSNILSRVGLATILSGCGKRQWDIRDNTVYMTGYNTIHVCPSSENLEAIFSISMTDDNFVVLATVSDCRNKCRACPALHLL